MATVTLAGCTTVTTSDRKVGVWYHCPRHLGEYADLPVCNGKMTVASLVIYPMDRSAVAAIAAHNDGARPKWRPLSGGMVQVLGAGDAWLEDTDPRDLPQAPDALLWSAARANLDRLARYARIAPNSLGVLQVEFDNPDWDGGLRPLDNATLALSDAFWRRPELAAFKGPPAFGFGGGPDDFLIADSADAAAMAGMRKELDDLISIRTVEEAMPDWKRDGRLIHHSPPGKVFLRGKDGTWALVD